MLAIMAIPTISSISEDALYAVGKEFKEASYALGATRYETITRVIVPTALSGISAAVILGMARAIGETMVVLMVAAERRPCLKASSIRYDPCRRALPPRWERHHFEADIIMPFLPRESCCFSLPCFSI
jgi:ABC-type phosphate transport system permease subunit